MKAAFLFTLTIILLNAEACPMAKTSFELPEPPSNVHIIKDCMHVTSESGDFLFKKVAHSKNISVNKNEPGDTNLVEDTNPMTVCGLYVMSDPGTTIKISMSYVDLSCESGGLMAFVDGWELNGQYFPGEKEHIKKLEDRVTEFCNDYTQWPMVSYRIVHQSTQNAALLQYRIPVKGSFVANVRFLDEKEPCNILVQDVPSVYTLKNYGHYRNCTLTAIFPAVVSIMTVNIGPKVENIQNKKINYECAHPDRLEIGGSSGLDSHNMEKSSSVCGHTNHPGPEQAIFCGVTSLRLVSSGLYDNTATILVRKAEDKDLNISTLICP